MEVIDDNAAMLSNFEVYTQLKEIQSEQSRHRRTNKHQQHLATILYSTLKHLEKTPCKDQNPTIISQFMLALMPFSLTKAEKLQLLNQRPTTAVEIQLMIEESEERLTENQIAQLLEIISTTLPGEALPAAEPDTEPMEQDPS